MHEAFEKWVKESGSFTDWSRYGDGYAKPLVDRTWRAWCAARKAGLMEARSWLRAQANAEQEPKARAAFIEAANAVLTLAESTSGQHVKSA